MKALYRSMMMGALVILAILAGVVQQASAIGMPGKPGMLLGTTGACKSTTRNGPCTQASTLVQLNPKTGALIKEIGPVGYTVNGLAWDGTSGKLYATTASGCGPDSDACSFHGLITIDLKTGAGTPVDATVENFGLDPTESSPIHTISIDFFGNLVGWYTESPFGDVTDTFVRINKRTGIAKEFPDTGIRTLRHGLSFSEFNLLWNIDGPQVSVVDGSVTQTAHIINPFNGKPFYSRSLSPPTTAALGDFNPVNNLYYGINFDPFDSSAGYSIVLVNPRKGTVTPLGPTVEDLHTLTFVKGPKCGVFR
jgi:hypothetical protein